MAFQTLDAAISKIDQIDMPETKLLIICDGYLSPGYMVLITSLAHRKGYTFDNLEFSLDQKSYATNIGVQKALDGEDKYLYGRVNSGKNYSPLVKLISESEVDDATSCIVGCVRNIIGQAGDGLSELFGVIGELHHNVWAHGKSTGYSMAQVYDPNPNPKYIQFAVCDSGGGFKRELLRVGLKDIESHQDAIEWCIQEGNSSKLRSDEWSQRCPDDMAGGAPFGAGVNTHDTDNHHQGLGLFKLVQLVERYGGTLKLLTGDTMMVINQGRNRSFKTFANSWDGVAIACDFNVDSLLNAANESPEVQNIMARIGRVVEDASN